jgi:RimJ/RimL family protein N-acetyltransferase
MNSVDIKIRRAAPVDIPFIMSVERLPGYSSRVGSWSHAEHESKLANISYIYLVCLNMDVPVGFVIFKDVDNPMGNLCLHRIAVGQSANGIGSAFVTLLIDWVFEQPDVFRRWLDVLPDNSSARHVYAKVGFAEEGIMRSALRRESGERADLILMAITRTDWEQRKRVPNAPGDNTP